MKALKGAQYKIPRLLLVDDDTDVVNVLCRGLEIRGFQVDGYTSPQNALDALEPNVYDLAILDIRMPGMNGFLLHRKLREIDPALTTCFLSAFEMHQDEFGKVFPSIAHSIKAIIKKPISINQLVREIAPILKLSSTIRAVPGEHILIIYDTSTELVEQALEFLRSGLENNEDVMFITDALPVESIRSKIKEEWKNFKPADLELGGRLTLYTFREWYMPEGKLDSKQAISKLTDKVNQSVARGKRGLRTVGDMNSFFTMGMPIEAINYENMLVKKLDLPVIGICAYLRDKVHQLDEDTIDHLRSQHGRVVGEESEVT